MKPRHLTFLVSLAAAGVLVFHPTAVRSQSTRNTNKLQCANCHSMHGSGGFLLNNANVEALCNSCHLPGSPGTATKVLTHKRTDGRSPYHGGNWSTTCTDCHNPHYDLYNQVLTKNIKLISNVRDDANGAKINTPAYDNGPCSDPAPDGGCFRFQVFANRTLTGSQSNWASTAPPYRGACNVCHTLTRHHRNSDSGGDHDHNITKVCTSCHLHSKSFLK